MTLFRAYSDLLKFKTFEDRFNYLKLDGVVCSPTFSFERYLNQVFYTSPEWRRLRNEIIIRDNGCDMALEDEPIAGNIYVHHMNPITPEDIETRSYKLFDPENLICLSYDTHQAITYGLDLPAKRQIVLRAPNDTCPWR